MDGVSVNHLLVRAQEGKKENLPVAFTGGMLGKLGKASRYSVLAFFKI